MSESLSPSSPARAPATQFASRRRIPDLPDLARGIVALALLVFALTTPGFLSAPSLLGLMSTMSFIGCVAVGMTFITLSGNIMSFSLGASLSVATVAFVALLPLGLGPAVAGTLLFGAILNGVQGWFIGYFRANPIIISMAAYSIIIGLFTFASEGRGLYITGGEADAFKGNLGPVPGPLLAFLLCVLAGQGILIFTRVGRTIQLAGSNPAAALAAGFEPWRTTTWAYVLAGVFTSVAAILIASRYGSGDLQHGTGFEYRAISAVLVGGTLIQGGSGSVMRTFVGTLVIAVFQAVLVLRGFSTEMQQLTLGLLVLAVIMLQWRRSA